ncbi:hypothetical protein BTUL_0016g00270 [Botrytis tulipae]|uniref:Uncharacterized protein n=1 Tax=Botrytis tulipae TaxID=87230 RepID=A0A4Z1EZ67_9HELO|nr:hypothetical protein BTUL_0016g00270 [Botrytis tulipae]
MLQKRWADLEPAPNSWDSYRTLIMPKIVRYNYGRNRIIGSRPQTDHPTIFSTVGRYSRRKDKIMLYFGFGTALESTDLTGDLETENR